MSEALPQFGDLIEQRMLLVRQLAASLESSQFALASNDAEAIACGAAHQAELCRQWSALETQLRCHQTGQDCQEDSPEGARSAELQAEWKVLSARIEHLARVHWSLLRHLERSLNVLRHLVESCAPTYTPDPKLLEPGQLELRTGE